MAAGGGVVLEGAPQEVPRRVSRFLDLDGPVHVVDHGGPEDPAVPLLVCVHGLGGSHANWHDVGPLLARAARVLAVDLAGHGRSPRAGRSASVQANRLLLHRVLEELAPDRQVVLVGNSMGATLSVLEAAAAPERVAGLVLIGPALPRARTDVPTPALARHVALCAVPPLAQRSLARRRQRLGAEAMIDETLALTTADPSRVSEGVRRLAVELLATQAAGPDRDAAYVEAARSVGLLVARAAALRAVIASVRAPALVLQGALDRLVPPSGVRQLATLQPAWTVEVLEGVGHVPQIECPEAIAARVLAWLASDCPRSDSLMAGAP